MNTKLKLIAVAVGALLALGGIPTVEAAAPAKIDICHVPPGNPSNGLRLTVAEQGWNGHDGHPLDKRYESKMTGSKIVGTTLTVGTLTSGKLMPGLTLSSDKSESDGGVKKGTKIVSGAGTSWVVDISQTTDLVKNPGGIDMSAKATECATDYAMQTAIYTEAVKKATDEHDAATSKANTSKAASDVVDDAYAKKQALITAEANKKAACDKASLASNKRTASDIEDYLDDAKESYTDKSKSYTEAKAELAKCKKNCNDEEVKVNKAKGDLDAATTKVTDLEGALAAENTRAAAQTAETPVHSVDTTDTTRNAKHNARDTDAHDRDEKEVIKKTAEETLDKHKKGGGSDDSKREAMQKLEDAIYEDLKDDSGADSSKNSGNAKHSADSDLRGYGDSADSGAKDKHKMTICHVPKGNPANKHTIKISASAWHAHKEHHGGDYIGSCNANVTKAKSELPKGETDPSKAVETKEVVSGTPHSSEKSETYVISGCTGTQLTTLQTLVESHESILTVVDDYPNDDQATNIALSQCLDNGDSSDSADGKKDNRKKVDSDTHIATGGKGQGRDSVTDVYKSDSGLHAGHADSAKARGTRQKVHHVSGCKNKDPVKAVDSSSKHLEGKHGLSDSDKSRLLDSSKADSNQNYHGKLKRADSGQDAEKSIKEPVHVSDSALDDKNVWKEFVKCAKDSGNANKIDSGKATKKKGGANDSGKATTIVKFCTGKNTGDSGKALNDAIEAHNASKKTYSTDVYLSKDVYQNDVAIKKAADDCGGPELCTNPVKCPQNFGATSSTSTGSSSTGSSSTSSTSSTSTGGSTSTGSTSTGSTSTGSTGSTSTGSSTSSTSSSSGGAGTSGRINWREVTQ